MKTHINGNAEELHQLFPAPNYESSYRSYWSSPEAWASWCLNFDRKTAWTDSAWAIGDKAWYGTDTLEEAVDLARNGWKEGVNKAQSLLNRIKAEHPIQLKPKRYGIAGTHPDVPRAISGNPLNMHQKDDAAGKRKIITLLSEMGASCGHGPEEFVNRAAVVAALIDAIEASGYACDVITYSNAISCDNHTSLHSCIVKNSNQPVDIARLAFGLGHPGMFRRFAFVEKCSEENKNLGYGLGYTKKLEEMYGISEFKEKNIFILRGINDTKVFKTEESAKTEGVKYIIDYLKEQGFPLYVKS